MLIIGNYIKISYKTLILAYADMILPSPMFIVSSNPTVCFLPKNGVSYKQLLQDINYNIYNMFIYIKALHFQLLTAKS
jgi:hypothetical protein